MKLKTKPWPHQKKALKFLLSRDFGALYTDMGSGKTKVLIDLIVNREFSRTLIIATKKICENEVWPSEFVKHSDGSICVLDAWKVSGDRRPTWVKEHLREGQNVLVMNYDSVWREPFRTFLLKKFKPDCVICDESHRIKSPGSKVSKFLQLLGRRTPYRYLMTGTPLGQSPLDIYAQYRFLDPTIFGTNFGNFKEHYCNLIHYNGISFVDKRNPYKNLDELQEKMFSCAFSMEIEQDLPPTQDIVVEFEMPAKAQRYYNELRKEGCLELKNGIVEAGNVLTVLTRLQQLTSGYLPLDDGTVELINTARQDTLKELLESIADTEPVVIFAKYRPDITNIRKVAKALGRTVAEISGRKNTFKKWNEGRATILAVQIAAGSEGSDFTKAKYQIYYTLSHSLVQYKQSRKRIHRPGQTRPVVYYTLVAKRDKGKTIDENILDSLRNNQNIVDTIMDTGEI